MYGVYSGVVRGDGVVMEGGWNIVLLNLENNILTARANDFFRHDKIASTEYWVTPWDLKLHYVCGQI